MEQTKACSALSRMYTRERRHSIHGRQSPPAMRLMYRLTRRYVNAPSGAGAGGGQFIADVYGCINSQYFLLLCVFLYSILMIRMIGKTTVTYKMLYYIFHVHDVLIEGDIIFEVFLLIILSLKNSCF